jgi:opacity protein-like surface antigen
MIREMLLGAALIVLAAVPANGQARVEITPFIGYQFSGDVEGYYGEVNIDDDVSYGAILDYTVRRGAQLELSYSRQDTRAAFRPYAAGDIESMDVAIEYLQAGGLAEVQKGKARPFVSFTLGATHISTDATSFQGRSIDDEWRFSMVLGGGVKIFPGERVGLRLQGHLLTTFLDSGGSMFCGTGGCSVGLFGAGILQGDVSGGLTIAF